MSRFDKEGGGKKETHVLTRHIALQSRIRKFLCELKESHPFRTRINTVSGFRRSEQSPFIHHIGLPDQIQLSFISVPDTLINGFPVFRPRYAIDSCLRHGDAIEQQDEIVFIFSIQCDFVLCAHLRRRSLALYVLPTQVLILIEATN